MPSYESWNELDEDDDGEVQEVSLYEGKKDVILFCIDCSPSMLELRDDPHYEAVKTCHLFSALEAALQVQKKKVIVSPSDAVGIMLFNTTRPNEAKDHSSEIKKFNFLYQATAQVDAPKIQELMQLLDRARDHPDILKNVFPPLEGGKMAMGDVFTSCNWVLRNDAPNTAFKRVFLITDDDDPHPFNSQLLKSAQTTLSDLTQSGAQVEPFFIATPEKPFHVAKFYSSVLLTNGLGGEEGTAFDTDILPESISITRIDDLLSQMRFHEVPKRALFSIAFELATSFTFGVKGYGLVTEQSKGTYKYFADLGNRMEVAKVRSAYLDEGRQIGLDNSEMVFGMSLGAHAVEDGSDKETEADGSRARVVPAEKQPFYTASDIRSFRTLGLEPGIKLLGFKDSQELAFEDNVKHSYFLHPDELKFSGSKRTFDALLKNMLKKKKIALVRALIRQNSSPFFCAMIPQAECSEEGRWNEPAGFHLIPLPFADDIRAAPLEKSCRSSDEIKDTARAWLDKLCVKHGTYPPDSYPNPALAFHNAQLQAHAFREDFCSESFQDLTRPKYDMMHKRAGNLIQHWKLEVTKDQSVEFAVMHSNFKRKSDMTVDEAEIRSRYEAGALSKLRVDQLKDFLKGKSQPVSGKKAELVERVAEWLEGHG